MSAILKIYFKNLIPRIEWQKEVLLWFRTRQNACKFPDVINAFQMRFDELSNSKDNKGDRTINTTTIYLLGINNGDL